MAPRNSERGDAELQKELLSSIKDSSRYLTTLTVTMLAVGAYLWFMTASVTHEALLRVSPLTMPLVDVKLPLNSFFMWAPPVMLVLHVNVLLHLDALRKKVVQFRRVSSTFWTKWSRLLPSLANHFDPDKLKPSGLLERMQRLMMVLIYLFPLAVMVLMFFVFLPYQGKATYLQFSCIACSSGFVLWCLVRKGGPLGPLLKGIVVLCAGFSLLGGFYLMIVPPGEGFKRLKVNDLVLLADSNSSNLRTGRECSELYSRLEARNEKIKGLDLSERSLKGANFAGACLLFVDLKGAKLHSANLRNANLSGADLGPKGAEEWPGWLESVEVRRRLASQIEDYGGVRTRLRDADMRGVHLVNANLLLADLESALIHKAILRDATLIEANLKLAELQQAVLTSADLYGARLLHSRLHGVDAKNSVLATALITGADFTRANLHGANFQGAKGYLSSFEGSDLSEAKFQRSSLVGGSFEKSDLGNSEGLLTHLNGFSYANVTAADLCPGSRGQYVSADLRGVVGSAECLPGTTSIGLVGGASKDQVQEFLDALVSPLLHQACLDEEVAFAVASRLECDELEFYGPHETGGAFQEALSEDCLLSGALKRELGDRSNQCDVLVEEIEKLK